MTLDIQVYTCEHTWPTPQSTCLANAAQVHRYTDFINRYTDYDELTMGCQGTPSFAPFTHGQSYTVTN